MILYLWLLCLLVPFVLVWAAGSLFWVVTDRSSAIAIDDTLFAQSGIASAPFVLPALGGTLALMRQPTARTWQFCKGASIVGIITTCVL
jgi:hypothetical protein